MTGRDRRGSALEFRRARQAFGFPPVSQAGDDGLLAVGGDLSPERLLVAYANGIFPWPSRHQPLLPWFCPSPRTVLIPGHISVNRSARKALRRAPFVVTYDRAFPEVIAACASVARREGGTWITPAMAEAYTRLHELGFAHSVEAWNGDTLAGGLYGVSLGAAFFGESMFRFESDASKVALLTLLGRLEEWGFPFVDCQMMTPHVRRLGAQEWELDRFQSELAAALEQDTRRGVWPP
ncbi:leucyl/phenylalanyl-tRNA--protein transferase [Actinoplanes sp. M2I2]|uniref:leucyl/phenylalanyl-tRNA--protein transferase n=1 Tax=Actinoplanes sp. M2I2 TaxID=1734444 RepID=UPI002021C999|nr:leucyl/phenylalanyl-tRNA--protein transferase [Actinoplanes sp. M2I2]